MHGLTKNDLSVPPPRGRTRDAGAFFRAFLAQPSVIGSVLPSSRWLARALTRPFLQRSRPAAILEIGAGTGAITRYLGRILGPEDTLAVCEVQPELVAHIEREVLTLPRFAVATREGRVELIAKSVQQIDRAPRFDYVISALPFTAFEPHVIKEVLDVVRCVLRPGGVFSYFEYFALRRLRTIGSTGAARRRMQRVSAVLDEHVLKYQVRRNTVLFNLPPALARHCRFDHAA